jgi:hypothetical protein
MEGLEKAQAVFLSKPQRGLPRVSQSDMHPILACQVSISNDSDATHISTDDRPSAFANLGINGELFESFILKRDRLGYIEWFFHRGVELAEDKPNLAMEAFAPCLARKTHRVVQHIVVEVVLQLRWRAVV